MNDFDEKKFRKQIRSELEEKHQAKKKKKQHSDGSQEQSGTDFDLSLPQKKYIRRIVEEELFKKYKIFIKSENHLNEIKWLTAIELADQYEYYPVEPTVTDRLKSLFRIRKKIPKSRIAQDFARKIREDIQTDINKRLAEYEKTIREHEEKEKENRVDEIIKQEEDNFFKSHPDYKLYKNELGQTKWMTEEEFSSQEEFSLEVKSFKQNLIYYIAYTFLALILIVSVWLLWGQFKPEHNPGYVIIKSNEPNGILYINEKIYVGFSQDKPVSLAPGSYTIALMKSGFDSQPRDIQIAGLDTVELYFELNKKSLKDAALVRLESQYDDAKIFINDEFFGTVDQNKEIIIEPGSHRIALKKESYKTIPQERKIDVNGGDTLNLSFTLVDREYRRSREGSFIKDGLLEVSSNVAGARIFLNGEDTGNMTDFVFNKLSFGSYNVSVEKEGYEVYPREKIVRITEEAKAARVDFKLVRSTVPVSITTQPVSGAIFINGKKMGEGKWSGSLPVGEHDIHFGSVDYYQVPSDSRLVIKNEATNEFRFSYELDYKIVFTPEKIFPNQSLGTSYKGYIVGENEFKEDLKHGPEIIFSNKINERIWQIGYAFDYKNPPGNDAILFSFRIPDEIDLSNTFKLKLWGYRTNKRFPFDLSSASSIRIVVNGIAIQNNYSPRYAVNEMAEDKFEEFLIGNLVRKGQNSVLISTTADNATYFALWKVAVE